MTERLDFFAAAPDLIKPMLSMEKAVRGAGLPDRLLHLIRLRASQINGCAYCIAMHTREARADGEEQRRLDLVSVHAESGLFSEPEEAALGWTEALTEVGRSHAPDAAYDRLAAAFSPAHCVAVTLAITQINAWNRFAIGFRKAPET